jgi:hypothetical protein
MGAAARNIFKIAGGSAIAAGIGTLIAHGTRTVAEQGPPGEPFAEHESIADRVANASEDVQETVQAKRESLRDRWERAQTAGEAAKEAREAELRAYFREKVDDPTAFPPGAPTRTDT